MIDSVEGFATEGPEQEVAGYWHLLFFGTIAAVVVGGFALFGQQLLMSFRDIVAALPFGA